MKDPICWLVVLDGERGLFQIVPIAHGADVERVTLRLALDISRLPCRDPEDYPAHLKEADPVIEPPDLKPHVYALAIRRTMHAAQQLAERFRTACPDARTPLPPWMSTTLNKITLETDVMS